jgi:hypothetical protein
MPSASIPAALATAAIVASVAGAGVGAYGAISAGNAAQSAANYQGQVAANNAIIADQNAKAATAAGNAQAEQQRMKTNAIIGAQMAGQASSGLDTGSGSPLDVRTSTKELGELDVLTIRNNAARQAYGYQTQSSSFTAQGALDRLTGANAATAGDIGGISSILGGASSVGKKFADFKTSGAFNNPSPTTGGAGP